jgi:hypothetical protein
MAESTLVDRMKDFGRELITHLTQDNVPISAAWWVKAIPENDPVGSREWFLFIASSLLDSAGPGVAYKRVYDAISKLRHQGGTVLVEISLGQIKVIGENDPITLAVFKILKRYPGGEPPPWTEVYVSRCKLGPIEAEEATIYPRYLWEKHEWKLVRLKENVLVDAPQEEGDKQIMQEIAASGITNTVQAGRVLWGAQHPNPASLQVIAAGTIVRSKPIVTSVSTPWPLVTVVAGDGKKGVTLASNTEELPPTDGN